MLRKLKTKSSQEIALERKEQGFTLYINGANAAFTQGRVAPQPPSTNQISNHKAHSRRYLATTQLSKLMSFFLEIYDSPFLLRSNIQLS